MDTPPTKPDREKANGTPEPVAANAPPAPSSQTPARPRSIFPPGQSTADTAKLAAHLAKAASEMRRVGKNATNDFQRYKYAAVGDVYNEIRGPLATNGIAMLVTTDHVEIVDTQTKKGDPRRRAAVRCRLIFTDGETGAYAEIEAYGEGEDTNEKCIQKAVTNAAKYGIITAFALPTGEDSEDKSGADGPSHDVIDGAEFAELLQLLTQLGKDEAYFVTYLNRARRLNCDTLADLPSKWMGWCREFLKAEIAKKAPAGAAEPAKAKAPKIVTKTKAATIRKKLAELGSEEAPFLEWLAREAKVEAKTIDEIPAAAYQEVVDALDRMIAEKTIDARQAAVIREKLERLDKNDEAFIEWFNDENNGAFTKIDDLPTAGYDGCVASLDHWIEKMERDEAQAAAGPPLAKANAAKDESAGEPAAEPDDPGPAADDESNKF